MPRPAQSPRSRLQLEHLEGRDVPTVVTIPTSADGLVADRNLDGTYDEVITNGQTISDRWLVGISAAIGQERGVFEFDLAGIAPGSILTSAAFGFDVSSFTSGSAGFPQLVVRAFAGDGGVSLADGDAASTLAGTGSVTALGAGQIALNPAAIQPLLGGNATIRVQNSALDANWASLYAIEFTSANLRARLVLDVAAPALSVSASPGTFSEAAGANAATGTVTRTGDLSQPLTVSLTSADTTAATVPASVTIPANQSAATFPIAAVDDLVADGSQTATITATAQIAGSGPLQLDPTYGTGGLAPTSLRQSVQFPHAAIAYLSDGKLLAASELTSTSWIVTRLNADGTVDSTFGTNGVVSTTLFTATSNIPVPYVIAIQPDGKYLVGGRFSGGPAAPVLVRYNTDGSLDGSFGAIATDALNTAVPNTFVTDIAVRPDGRILLGLGENGPVFSRVAQLQSTGALDPTFGFNSSGVTSLNAFSNFGVSAEQVELLSDGSFLAAGSFQSSARVAQVAANGTSLVSSFGGGLGFVSVNFATASVGSVQLQRDSQGRIVYGTYISNNGSTDFAAARLNPNGSMDTSFAGDGTAVLSSPTGEDIVTGMVIQPDDKIVLGGVSIVGGVYDSALGRFNADGTPDTTFDGDGFYRQSLVNTFSPDLIFDIALQSDGKLLALTGWATDVRVARFDSASQPTTLTATTSVTVLDDEPAAQTLAFSTNEDVPLTGVLVATDLDNDPLTYSVVAQPASGTVQITNAATGAFRYIPPPNFNGTVSFTYKANDGGGDSNVATVTITVVPVNDPPVPSPLVQNLTTPEDTPLSGQLAANDPEGDAVTFTLEAGPSNGTLTLAANGAFTFTPNANFNGLAQFVYRASDPSGAFRLGGVNITVTPVNDAPTAVNDAFTVAEDGVLSVTAAPVTRLRMVSDPGDFIGQGLTYDFTPANAAFSADTNFDNGVSLDVDPPAAGEFWFLDFAAPNNVLLTPGTYLDAQRFPFQAADKPGLDVSGNGRGSNTLTGRFTVFDVVRNAAQDDVLSFAAAFEQHSEGAQPALVGWVIFNSTFGAGGGVLANDTDVEGDLLLGASLVSGPSHGTLSFKGDGTFTYTPDPNFNGTDSFTYRANDGRADGNVATVTINVSPVNDAPVASAASLATDEDVPFAGTLSATDVDSPTLTYSRVAGPSNGALVVNPDGTFTYTPNANFNGTDSFTFKANDGSLDSNVATVSITVRAVNDAPTLAGATFSLPENSPNGTAVGAVTGADVDGDALSYSITGGNAGGAFAIDPATGAITVANSAALDFEATPVFDLTVQVRDPGGLVGTATVRVNLTDVPESFTVAIDVKPGDARNRINPRSQGKIEVAILSTATFDARQVDVESLRFGRTGTEDSLSQNANKGPRYRYEDVNGDGRLDLVVQFEIESTGFLPGDTKGILTGRLLNGVSFTGEDLVSVG